MNSSSPRFSSQNIFSWDFTIVYFQEGETQMWYNYQVFNLILFTGLLFSLKRERNAFYNEFTQHCDSVAIFSSVIRISRPLISSFSSQRGWKNWKVSVADPKYWPTIQTKVYKIYVIMQYVFCDIWHWQFFKDFLLEYTTMVSMYM